MGLKFAGGWRAGRALRRGGLCVGSAETWVHRQNHRGIYRWEMQGKSKLVFLTFLVVNLSDSLLQGAEIRDRARGNWFPVDRYWKGWGFSSSKKISPLMPLFLTAKIFIFYSTFFSKIMKLYSSSSKLLIDKFSSGEEIRASRNHHQTTRSWTHQGALQWMMKSRRFYQH